MMCCMAMNADCEACKANMSKEEKMAKMRVKPLRAEADTKKAEGSLTDASRYEEALAFIEDEKWILYLRTRDEENED